MSMPHAVQFYNDDVFLIETVCSFIKAGSEEGTATIVIATKQHREELHNTLQGADIPGIEDKITYFDAGEMLSAFMVDGWPDQPRFTSTVGLIVQQAALAGPVRIFGEMVAVLRKERLEPPFASKNCGKSWQLDRPSRFSVPIRCRAFRSRKRISSFFRSATLIHTSIHLNRPPIVGPYCDHARTSSEDPLYHRRCLRFSRCRWSNAAVHTSGLFAEMKRSTLLGGCIVGSDSAVPPASLAF
jgi:hypothetical protein